MDCIIEGPRQAPTKNILTIIHVKQVILLKLEMQVQPEKFRTGNGRIPSVKACKLKLPMKRKRSDRSKTGLPLAVAARPFESVELLQKEEHLLFL